MKLLRLHIVRLLLMTLIVLPAVTSCYNYDQEESVVDSDPAANYINVTISVSASDNAFTRAPLGGEYGDGTEKGIEREYKVKTVTLIFYKDEGDPNTNINTNSETAVVKCVKRYIVRPITDNDLPTGYDHSHKTGESTTAQGQEVLYTTGNQKLDDPLLEIGETYKLLVVANTYVDVNVGEKIKDVRDNVLDAVYTGSGSGVDATDFVMTSETDASVTLADPTIESTSSQTNRIYYFPCIHLERLAARIDYYTKGAEYSATYQGYKYNLGSTDDDGFYVVTKVTPFNLYNGQEFLFKRVRDNWTDATPVVTYLGNEGLTNYVVDPQTAYKDNSNTVQPDYLSPILESMGNSYAQMMNNVGASQKFEILTKDNIIIAYPKENTLMPSSYLKKYATGIAFEAKYYANASANPLTRVYYHYLRHQGELDSGSYQAKQWADLIDTESTSSHTPLVPMNYGVVRNNIYRISIEGFSTVEGTIKIKIEEKKWRHVDNPTIYI